MRIRNQTYSIEELFITSDVDFNSITAEEQNIIAQYCYSNITPFKTFIDKLINDYRSLIVEAQREILISNQCQELSHTIQTALSQTNEILKQLAQIEKSHYPLIFIAQIIKGKLNSVNENNNELGGLINNQGIKRLECCLVFCINMLLDVPFQIENPSVAITESYSNIAKSLAEFWYEEGDKISPTQHKAHKKVSLNVLRCIKLFMMSVSKEKSILESACYAHILKKEFEINIEKKINLSQFDLELFARQSPEAYQELHYYLFQHRVDKEYLCDSKNLHTYFNSGLFDLYVFLATHKTEFAQYAINIFLNCLEKGMPIAAQTLEKYAVELQLDVNTYIKLAIYYFKTTNKEKFYELSINKISEQLTKANDEYLFKIVELWVKENNVNLKNIAIEVIQLRFQRSIQNSTSTDANNALSLPILINYYLNIAEFSSKLELVAFAINRLKNYVEEMMPHKQSSFPYAYSTCMYQEKIYSVLVKHASTDLSILTVLVRYYLPLTANCRHGADVDKVEQLRTVLIKHHSQSGERDYYLYLIESNSGRSWIEYQYLTPMLYSALIKRYPLAIEKIISTRDKREQYWIIEKVALNGDLETLKILYQKDSTIFNRCEIDGISILSRMKKEAYFLDSCPKETRLNALECLFKASGKISLHQASIFNHQDPMPTQTSAIADPTKNTYKSQ